MTGGARVFRVLIDLIALEERGLARPKALAEMQARACIYELCMLESVSVCFDVAFTGRTGPSPRSTESGGRSACGGVAADSLMPGWTLPPPATLNGPEMNCEVRPATRDDLPAILEIYNHAVLHTTASYDYEPRTLEHRTTWFEDHERTGHPVFVAADPAGTVVGWSALNRYHDRMGYRFTTENSVYVAEAARGKGVGSLLLAPLITSAKELGLHAIIAAIDAQNESSVRLHAKFGFEKVGLFRQVGYKFDRWLDVVYMERIV